MIFFIPEGSKLRGSLLSCFKYQQLSGGGGSRSGYYSTSSGGGSGNSFYQASAYERAKSSGQSSYNWFNSKLKEAGNIWNSWTKGMEKTVKHFCTTANRIKKGTNEFLKNIDWKNLSGLAGIFNTIGTKTWGKLINKITDNNRTEKEVFDLVKTRLEDISHLNMIKCMIIIKRMKLMEFKDMEDLQTYMMHWAVS